MKSSLYSISQIIFKKMLVYGHSLVDYYVLFQII